MESSILKKIISLFLSVVMMGAISIAESVDFQGEKTDKKEQATKVYDMDQNRVISAKEVTEDVEEMIDSVESVHPIFLEEVPQKYWSAKEKLESIKGEEVSLGKFELYISEYLTSLNDGHTRINKNFGRYIDISWIYRNDELLIVEEGKMTDKKVLSVGGVNIEKIFESVSIVAAAENESGRIRNYSIYSKFESVLEMAGVDVTKAVELEIDYKGEIIYEEKAFMSQSGNRNNGNVKSATFEKLNEDTAYIDFRLCNVDKDLLDTTKQLKEAVSNGTKNVIIDVSNNPGGNSNAGKALLEAMDMKVPSFGVIMRYSLMAQKQNGYSESEGDYRWIPEEQELIEEDQKVNLYVITSERTFSSATMFSTWVRDGKLGKIVGRASANSPSAYGDIIYFTLNNSGLKGTISHKKFTRPDLSKDKENSLEPDIYVEFGEDSLKVVKEKLNIRD